MPPSTLKPAVLFLCTGNSCRSQMAEGWARHLHGDLYDFYSAGLEKHGMNPLAIEAMAADGLDITGQRSKRIEELPAIEYALVITLCGNADEHCPVLPQARHRLHHGFDDPPRLAAAAATEHEALAHYIRVSREIRDYLADLPHIIAAAHAH